MKQLVRVFEDYVLYAIGVSEYRLVPISGGTAYNIAAGNDESAIIQAAAIVKERDARTWN